MVFEKIRPDRQMGPKKITSFAVLFFSFLLKNGPFNEASFFLTQLSWSIHVIKSFYNPMNMKGFDKKSGKTVKKSKIIF